MKNLNSGGAKSGKINRMKSCEEIDAELEYSKDKFAGESFLDSLMFYIVVSVLIIMFLLWKNYQR